MSITEKILDVIGGGLVSGIIDVAKSYFPTDSREDLCFLSINLIVLIFLFGEKAFKNIAPLIERLLSVRK